MTFAPGTPADGRRLLERLVEQFDGRARRTRAALRRVYLDTFDWRLWNAGRALAHETTPDGGRLCRVELDGRPERSIEVGHAPRFGWELPRGPWRDELAPQLEVRRLLPVAELELERERLSLLDTEGKTVARVELTNGAVVGGFEAPSAGDARALPCRLVLRPLRGYPRIAATVCETLEHGAERLAPAPSELSLALERLGVEPSANAGRFRVRLTRSISAAAATRAILAELLATVRRNERGVRDDLDPEFLHDMRVAIRRARTCLGELRSTVPATSGRELRRDLAWIGRATGGLRDLDVWLLRLGEYRAALPSGVRDELVPLRDRLRAQRVEARRRALARLDAARYARLLERWARLSSRGGARDLRPSSAAPDAHRPALDVAAERIARRVDRLLTRGRAIDSRSPDEALHALRIDAKKLRYLFEFYGSLFKRKPLTRVVGRLRRLQETLGEFNDLSVQQASLERVARELAAAGPLEPGPLLAIGRLVARLDALAADRRVEFDARFARFAAPKNLARIETLLGHEEPYGDGRSGR